MTEPLTDEELLELSFFLFIRVLPDLSRIPSYISAGILPEFSRLSAR
jgi:hypothetical protein